MGEYYSWVNVDKKEYFCPDEFGCGNKLHEQMGKDSLPLSVLHSLLEDEWKGCRILWLGDECTIPEQSSNAALQLLYEQMAKFENLGFTSEMIPDMYRDVACFFQEAEEYVLKEIGYYLENHRECGELGINNYYGIDPNDPYAGLFFKSGRRYKYIINHTRKIYYSLNETAIFLDGNRDNSIDPLPLLLSYGRVAEPGKWLGDAIGVTDNCPEEYTLMRELHVDW